MKNGNIDLKGLTAALPTFGRKLLTYAGFGFFLLLAAVYAFMILRINVLSNAQPDPSDVSSAQIVSPHVDTNVASHLESLKDNSVNVKTIYNDSRNDPFNE